MHTQVHLSGFLAEQIKSGRQETQFSMYFDPGQLKLSLMLEQAMAP